VNLSCNGFRAALEAELVGRPSQEKLAWLSWNEHLLSCADCRELLEKEEALEALLASLPEPRLPAPLLRRVLARLRRERAEEVRLEGLLDALGGVPAPEGLAANVLAKLASERRAPVDAALDALLDLDRSIPVPAGLGARVLAGLSAERRAKTRTQRRDPRLRPVPWIYAAAASVAILFAGRFVWVRAHAVATAPIVKSTQDAPPDPALLASLDVVEHWDELVQGDVDVLLSTLGPADEALLDYR
jgi:hypothetical protein